ncbi:hypothetical protein ACFL5P_02000 [candidate division KSB1 bacterium]
MSSDNTHTKREPLFVQILEFSKWRKIIAVPLIIIGIIGLVLPFLQGLLIIFLGIMLINPDAADNIRNHIKRFF